MRTKIKLSGNPKDDIETLLKECTNNNQICYHLKTNQYLIDYLKAITGLDLPVMILFYHFKEGIKEMPKCICGDNRKYHCDGYRPTCTRMECQNIIREESKKKFCLDHYGVEYIFQDKKFRENAKKTLIKKYGVDNVTKLPEVIKKRKEDNFKKYGVTDPIMLDSIRNDTKRGMQTIQKGLPEGYLVLESDKNTTYKLSCPKGHIFNIIKSNLAQKKKNNIEICNQCNEYIGSNGEQDLYNYISSIYSGNILRSNRKLIAPFEIDMVLENIKLCIEFNGDYWHSDNIVYDQYYHVNKLNLCLLKGYKLIQIKEHEWNINKDTIKRRLFNLINNIFDIKDFDMNNNILKIDLSWYDDRAIDDSFILENNELPQLIKVGQYNQWNCGYKIYKKYE